jgi:drug/metabolite transporter (DMT)-like permease
MNLSVNGPRRRPTADGRHPASAPGTPDPAVADAPPGAGGALLGRSLILLAAAGFGVNAILAKRSYEAGVGLVTLLAVRYVASAAVVVPLALTSRRMGVPRVPLRGALLVAAAYLGSATAYWLALRLGRVSDVAPLVFVYPALVAGAGALVHGERHHGAGLLGLGLAIAGCVLLFGAPGGGVGALPAQALALLAALCSAAYFFVGPRAMTPRQSLQGVGLMCLAGALVYTPALAFAAPSAAALERAWPELVGITVFGTAAPLLLYQVGMSRVGATPAALLSLFEPVVTVALALVILGERVAPPQAAGIALVLASFALASRRPRAVA